MAHMATADEICQEHGSAICRAAWRAWEDEDIAKALDVASVPLKIIGILIVGWFVHRLVRRFIRRTVQGLQGERLQKGLHRIRKRTPRVLLSTDQHVSLRRVQRATTIGALLRSASTVVIAITTAFLVLNQLTVDLAPFVAGTAIATAALGFGAQNIVRDFLAGFFIVVEDQYGVGDFIDLGESRGIVESVSLRITRIRGSDGTLWHVPNGEIKRVGNKSQAWARAVVELRVDPAVAIDDAMETIMTAARTLREDPAFSGSITEEPEIWGPEDVTGDGTLFKLAVRTKPLEQWRVSRALRIHVKEAFDREGYKFAPVPAE